MVAEGRSARLFRAHREGAHADHPERADAQDRRADPDEDGGRARVAGLLARRPARSRSTALRNAVGDIFTRRPRHQGGHQPDQGRRSAIARRRYSPDGKFIVYTARVSGNEKLFRLDLDTKKKTQITFGTQDETGAQFIDDHTIVFAIDGHRPGGAARARGRAQRQHPQHLDARPEERRAAAVHRRGRRQLVADRAERGQDQPDRVRQLLQGRVQHPHARAEGAAAHRGDAPTSARPARSSTSRRRCSTRWWRRTTARRDASRRCSSKAGRR